MVKFHNIDQKYFTALMEIFHSLDGNILNLRAILESDILRWAIKFNASAYREGGWALDYH